jgi:hypothetical protein
MAYVYRHIRLDKNEPFYVGIGKTIKRAHSKKNRNNHWHNIINITDYEVEILFDDLTWEQACQKEIEFIKLYGRRDLNTGILCNMTDGGDGTLNIQISEERRYSMSKNAKGQLNAFYGKHHSQETIQIISQKAIGRKMSDNVKVKISKSLTGSNNYWYGKKLSEQHKLKLSIAAKGRITTDDKKEILRNSSPKRIELYRFINGEFYIYKSFREAELLTGIERRYIKNHMHELGFISREDAINKKLM